MSQGRLTKEATVDTQCGHFINYVRVATAVAVIRSKPSNINILDHAKAIHVKYLQGQQHWKDRAHKLEDEVLSLKQRLIQSQMNLDFPLDHGFKDEDQNVFLTPPCSSDPEQSKQMNNDELKLTEHVNFLQSLVVLKTMSRNNGKLLELDSFTLDTSIKTVNHALSVVQRWMCSDELYKMLPQKSVEHCVSVLVDLVDGTVEAEKFNEEISQTVLSFTEAAIKSLLSHNHLNNFKYQEGLQRIVKTLIKSTCLRYNMGYMLTKCIHEYSELLRQIKQGQRLMEPHLFENVYLILQCLEDFVEIDLKVKPENRTANQLIYTNISHELDKCLLHISETFPSFAHYIWHIGGLIETIKQNY